MNISLFLVVCFVLICDETIAKSGGGGGRGGGGRGSSGARSSSSRSFSRSGGGKFHGSSHSSSSSVYYDSSSFRSSVFGKSSNQYFSPGTSSYVIHQPATPIIYDNHYYYWHGYYHSRPEKKTVCEYDIGDEDGELMNVTFANGTSPKKLVFGCGSWEKCCGMSCCNVVGDWIAL